MSEIHDFHLWSLSDEKPIFTAHVVCTGNTNYALFTISQLLKMDFDIHHSTVQVEPAKHGAKSSKMHCLNELDFTAFDLEASENRQSPEV